VRLLVLNAAVLALVAPLAPARGAIAADPDAIYGGSILWDDHYGKDDPVAVAMADFVKLVRFPSLRNGCDWAVVERTRGTYDWSNYDRKLNWVHSLGLKTVLVVGTAPEWATDSPPEARKILRDRGQDNLIGCLPIRDDCWPDYERYLRAAVMRYRDIIDYYEIWNEPDGMCGTYPIRDANGKVKDVGYGGNAEHYVKLLKHSYPIIKELDPTAVVGAGSMESKGGLQTTFAQGIYTFGGKPYFDAISIHSYGFPFNFDWLRTVREVMVKNGDAAKPMWITEYALNWQHVSEDAKAGLARSALRYLRETPWLSLSSFHFANIMWVQGDRPQDLKPRPMATAYRETTMEKGPRAQFSDGFENGIGEWYYHEGNPEAAITNENPHSGKAALTAAGGEQVTFFGSAYVAAPKTLEFWYYLKPDDAKATITLEAALYPGDIAIKPVWFTVEAEAKTGEWAHASVDLAQAAPALAGKTIVDIALRARSNWRRVAFTIDDVLVK
jgi:hypothetical protein